MRWLIPIGLVVALGAGAAHAATPAEVLCAPYKAALAKETDHAKREGIIKSMPHGCEVKAAPAAPRKAAPQPVAQEAPVPEAIPEQSEPPPVPMPAGEPLPPGMSVDQAKQNGNKAYAAKDYAAAMRWYMMAASQGDAAALDDVGEFYFYGHGVPVDYGQAMIWYRRAAAKGNATAEDGIGALYARGQGVSVNYAEAMKWFRMAAAQNNSDASNWMGYFYAHGLGVPMDQNQAQNWYAKSAADRTPH
jgi:TPR repeat protein